MLNLTSIPLERSKTGTPCLWESGGKNSHRASVQIIASHAGRPKKALFTRQSGDRCCKNHALIPVSPGDIIVRAEWDVDIDFLQIAVFRISKITPDNALLVKVQEMDGTLFAIKEWISGSLKALLTASVEKVQHYHCKTACYAILPEW